MSTTPLDPHLFGADQQCFGCGPTNHNGMQLQFALDGEVVTTEFKARAGWDGPPGIVHGGLQATLADEIGAWTVVARTGYFGFTSTLKVRYLRPARSTLPIQGRGELLSHEGAHARVRITLLQAGQKLLVATASYVLPDVEQAERILKMKLPDAYLPLARPSQD